MAASGIIYSPDDIDSESLNLTEPKNETKYLNLNKLDVYKELRLRGYDYGGIFKGISHSDNNGIIIIITIFI